MTLGKWWYNFRTRHGVAMCTFFVGLAPTHAFIMHAAVCAGTIWRKSWCLLKGKTTVYIFHFRMQLTLATVPYHQVSFGLEWLLVISWTML